MGGEEYESENETKTERVNSAGLDGTLSVIIWCLPAMAPSRNPNISWDIRMSL